MVEEIKDFSRLELFNHYNECDNPFIVFTTKIDVTNIVNYCKVNKNFYATMGYYITKTANKIDNFKYRYHNDKFYYCPQLISNYTQMFDENSIGYFAVPMKNSLVEYVNDFRNIQDKFLNDRIYLTENTLEEIWLSCQPWFNFTSMIPPLNKKITIPQFIWDKFWQEDDKYYLHLMISVHHGFADGFHIGKFINLLQKELDNFNI